MISHTWSVWSQRCRTPIYWRNCYPGSISKYLHNFAMLDFGLWETDPCPQYIPTACEQIFQMVGSCHLSTCTSLSDIYSATCSYCRTLYWIDYTRWDHDNSSLRKLTYGGVSTKTVRMHYVRRLGCGCLWASFPSPNRYLNKDSV